MRKPLIAGACLLLAPGLGVAAEAPTLQGYVEVRAAHGAAATAWSEGGLAKARFGDGDGRLRAGAGLELAWQATPALLASAAVQYNPDLRKSVDLVDARVRYRPVSTTRFRWSATAGMFFPPISLENDGVAWTSPWALSPSAINSWVGEELRVFGAEAALERRGENGTLSLRGAVFGRNDPAGELLASRGWALGDLTTGLDASIRQPDAHARFVGAPEPMRFRPFVEVDHRLGWYGALDWQAGDQRARLLYYDNRADPTREVDYAGRELYAWHTRFWSGGVQRRAGRWWWLAQGMAGKTRFVPDGQVLDTQFESGFVLAAVDLARGWQPVVRFDAFHAAQRFNHRPALLGEHGHAATLALNWRPVDRVRVTAEWLRIDSTRRQRLLAGLPAREIDTQWQLALRVFR